MRQLRGLGQTIREGRFGAHVLKKMSAESLFCSSLQLTDRRLRNKGGTADTFRPLDKDGVFFQQQQDAAGKRDIVYDDKQHRSE